MLMMLLALLIELTGRETMLLFHLPLCYSSMFVIDSAVCCICNHLNKQK